MEVLKDKDVKIRKSHQCIMCLRIFEKGSIMHFQTIKEDDLYTVYTCLDCESIKDKIETDIDGYYSEACVLTEMSERGFKGSVEEFIEYLKKQ